MVQPKILTETSISRCYEMLADLAAPYHKHLTITGTDATNTAPTNPSVISVYQLVFEVLRQKMTLAGINCDLIGYKDINGTCYKLYRAWKDSLKQ